jgi:23S rRNA (cytidine1920-2'-O)/16S rRNA (cytidine1409-2'-O)-methyltransferase
MSFVSRAGQKLEHALIQFGIDVTGFTCADLGCSTGGFTDCLLQRGAAKVFSVDTGYGVIEWKLRKDPRVVVMERTNAIHVELPEQVDLVTIDVGWTKQRIILPAAKRILRAGGNVISLVKPQYEASETMLRKGILPDEHLPAVMEAVKTDIGAAGFRLVAIVNSPIKGAKGNAEVLAQLQRL